MAMGTIMHTKERVLLLAAAMFVVAAAMPRMAGAVVLGEGETNLNGTIGAIVPDKAHFVSLSVGNASTEKITADCVTENGSGTTVYDGTCTVNDVLENPCVITGNSTTVVAEDAKCVTFTSIGLTSTAGEVISVATSGPLAGCGTGGVYLPWSSETGAFIIGLIATYTSPFSFLDTISCPASGAGGIGEDTSFPP
jgi:hypothetical protein